MADLWNSWEVQPPPVCTVKTVVNAKEMTNIKQLLFEMVKSLTGMRCLDQEAAILSRYLFKYKRIFRHDKGMQNLVKIHQCLKRYLKLNLSQVVTSYKQCFQVNYPSTQGHLPTKQMLKWILLRLQAFSKIFVRLIELAKESGSFYYGKLLLGWSLNSTIFIFSLIARILICSKFLVLKAIEWYNSLHRYLPFFSETVEFLPGYKFPTELKKWLGDVDLIPLKKNTSIDQIFELIDLVKDGEDEDDDVRVCKTSLLKNLFNSEVIEIDSDDEEVEVGDVEIEKPPPQPSTRSALNVEDVGIPVDDDDDEIQEIEPPKKKFRKEFQGKMRNQQQKHGRGFRRWTERKPNVLDT